MNDFASSSCHDRIADFKITQVQRDSHFDMGESHYHPYYEFYYLLSGQCRCFISHSIYRLFPGDLIMIPPSVLHRVLYETKRPAERINIFFSEDYLHRVSAASGPDLCVGLFSRSRLTIPSSSRPQLERLMTRLRLESESSDPYAPLMTKSLFQSFWLRSRAARMSTRLRNFWTRPAPPSRKARATSTNITRNRSHWQPPRRSHI